MGRASDFVDPDYDRRLAEYKAMKAKMKQEGQAEAPQSNSNSQRRF